MISVLIRNYNYIYYDFIPQEYQITFNVLNGLQCHMCYCPSLSMVKNKKPKNPFAAVRWPNTVCALFTDSVSDAIKRTLGLW